MVTATDNITQSRQAFQGLKTRLHRQIVDAIDLSKAGELSEGELRTQIQALSKHVCSLHSSRMSDSDRDQMVTEIMDEMYGFGPLQKLMNDPEVSDVLVNGADTVFIEKNGLLQKTDVQFANDAHLLQYIQRLVGRAGRRIDEVSPLVDATACRWFTSSRGHSSSCIARANAFYSSIQIESSFD